jgi:hypothetical protein
MPTHSPTKDKNAGAGLSLRTLYFVVKHSVGLLDVDLLIVGLLDVKPFQLLGSGISFSLGPLLFVVLGLTCIPGPGSSERIGLARRARGLRVRSCAGVICVH